MKFTIRDYLKEEIIKRDNDHLSLYNYDDYNKFLKESGSDCNYSSYTRKIRDISKDLQLKDIDAVYDDDYVVKLEAGKQKFQDKNNIINKSNRESYRLYNHLSDLYKGYVDVMSDSRINFKSFKIKSEKIKDKKKWGILQFSDWHGNKKIELKEDLDNEYNFTILSKRLKKYITEAISYFKFKKVENVCVILTGDLLTSDLRESQKMNRVTNQIKASLLISYIIKQSLLELNSYFGLKVACVVGNESRLSDFMASDEILATQNYDFLIYNNLRLWLSDSNIDFDVSSNYREKLLKLDTFNAIILHGDTLKSGHIGKQLKDIMTKYALRGIRINAIFVGHIHSSLIGDIFSRSSSLIGIDPYPDKDLHLFDGRASHNIYLVNDDDSYDGIKIDLQNTDKIEGYDIKKELETYFIEENYRYNNRVVIENYV